MNDTIQRIKETEDMGTDLSLEDVEEMKDTIQRVKETEDTETDLSLEDVEEMEDTIQRIMESEDAETTGLSSGSWRAVGGEPPPPLVVDLITLVAGGAWGSPLTILFRFNPDCVPRQPSPILYPVHRKQHHPLYHRVRGAALCLTDITKLLTPSY